MPAPIPPPRYDKAPRAKLDYGFDWTLWLDGDAILTSTWVLDQGLTRPQPDTFTSTRSTVWLGGGVAGSSYKCTNYITTASSPSRIDERSLYIDCVAL